MSINDLTPNKLNPLKFVSIEEFNNVVNMLLSKIEELESSQVELKSELKEVKSELKEVKSKLEKNDLLLKASIKRTTRLENTVFECYEDGDIKSNENGDPVISSILLSAPVSPDGSTELKAIREIPTIETSLDIKACAVVHWLQEDIAPNDFGEICIGRGDLKEFFKDHVDPKLQMKNVSRQLKADIFKRAVELFPDVVFIGKGRSGNKTTFLTLKKTINRLSTSACMRISPLGILA